MSVHPSSTPATGDAAAAPDEPARGFADRLRVATRLLHRRAERSGVVGEIMSRRAERYGYALLLRNLLPAYARLELELQCGRHQPGVCRVAEPAVYRAPAIELDLEDMYGSAWRRCLPLLPAARLYERAVGAAAGGDASRLIAHAYTRYLGDLNGGRALRGLLVRAMGLPRSSLSFYEFPAIAELEAFKTDYRAAIDRAGAEIADRERVIGEARLAFRLNIAVSDSVQQAVCRR